MGSEENPSHAIDEAVERGLLVHGRGSLTFRHELARRAVEEMQPPAKAAALPLAFSHCWKRNTPTSRASFTTRGPPATQPRFTGMHR
jgi:hypothetical protein